MSDTATPIAGAVALAADDRERMARLFEEVSGRLAEMGLIVSRTLDLEHDDRAQPQFKPARAPQQLEDDRPIVFKGVEIICGPSGCGCYDHDEGLCFPC